MAYNILLVDHSDDSRSITKKTIGMANIELERLFETSRTEEAIRILEEEWIDLILVDMNAEKINGVGLTQYIQSNPDTAEIPIVVISTQADDSNQKDLEKIGLKGYLQKPFSPEQICEAILETIGACHAEN